MAGLSGPASGEPRELFLEAGDADTGSETELLSASDGGFRGGWRRTCRAQGHGRLRLRLGAAAGCLALACTLVASKRFIAGPARSSSLGESGISLDILPTPQCSQCSVDEEYFGGLCYKKCMHLTSGDYPIRTSAMTCCKSHPCGLFNQKHDMGLCSGFSVAGGSSGACPHPPGCCLADEEMLLGQCYKKCALLTQGKYVHRVAPGTCCNRDSEIMCLMPKTGYSVSDIKFNVGGGDGSEAGFHMPLTNVDSSANLSTTAAAAQPSADTTLRPSAAPEARNTQPPLPDWYKDMQAQQGGTDTQVQSTTLPKNNPTPPPVPDWAQDAESTPASEPATAAPTPAPFTVATVSPAPAPATVDTVAPAPAPATVATAGPAPAPVTIATVAPAPALRPVQQATTPKPAGTSMPEWLQEIVAEPEDAEGAETGPPTGPPTTAAPAATVAPAAADDDKMPDWAKSMLDEQEVPEKETEAKAAAESAPAASPAAGGKREGAPPIPDWAKEYVAGSQ